MHHVLFDILIAYVTASELLNHVKEMGSLKDANGPFMVYPSRSSTKKRHCGRHVQHLRSAVLSIARRTASRISR